MDTDEHGFSTSKRYLPNHPIDETGNVKKFFIISVYPRLSVVWYSLKLLYCVILGKHRAARALIGLSGYAPPDAKISLATLTAHLTTLSELNQTLPAHAQTLADAIVDRQEAYTGATGLKFVFAGVKTSVKGQYGQSSLPFTSLSGMRW